LNGSEGNECVTFITISSNQISQGKTQDTTDAPTSEEIKIALEKLKKIIKLLGQTTFQVN